MGGRPKLLDAKKVALAKAMHADKTVAISDICEALRIGRTTLYRYLTTPSDRGHKEPAPAHRAACSPGARGAWRFEFGAQEAAFR